ncbi:MAG TPA: class I SAM-dependent methyltransferase [Thermoanaerobaculia bacterium]|nr:class I SAM-dependent methyltransferase [Thermoanaerobaculia bacterium]
MFEPETILSYVTSMTRESSVAKTLRERTSAMPMAVMQISPDEAALLSFLVTAIGAKKALEIGTFTGYSALAIASALPAGGTLVCCDVSVEWTNVGKEFWREAGVAERIDLRIAPALETLRALIENRASGTFDFAFVDAEKSEYAHYYELVLQLLRPGGVMVLDNMLRDGQVADPSVDEPGTVVIRELNQTIRDDARVDAVLLTIRDGVMLVRKR